jgi:beta-lactamase class A
LTLAEVLHYAVSESDNDACDILFRLYGGTKKTEQYIKNLGIRDISIKTTEQQQQHGRFSVQYTNWTTPYAAILNPDDRLKAGLPKM